MPEETVPAAYTPEFLRKYTRPSSYVGPDYFEYYPVAGQSRDSDALERSNFKSMLAALGGENEEAGVIVVRDSHWLVGWVETIYVHESATDKLKIADEIKKGLEDYPIIDEEAFSKEEQEERDALFPSAKQDMERAIAKELGEEVLGYLRRNADLDLMLTYIMEDYSAGVGETSWPHDVKEMLENTDNIPSGELSAELFMGALQGKTMEELERMKTDRGITDDPNQTTFKDVAPEEFTASIMTADEATGWKAEDAYSSIEIAEARANEIMQQEPTLEALVTNDAETEEGGLKYIVYVRPTAVHASTLEPADIIKMLATTGYTDPSAMLRAQYLLGMAKDKMFAGAVKDIKAKYEKEMKERVTRACKWGTHKMDGNSVKDIIAKVLIENNIYPYPQLVSEIFKNPFQSMGIVAEPYPGSDQKPRLASFEDEHGIPGGEPTGELTPTADDRESIIMEIMNAALKLEDGEYMPDGLTTENILMEIGERAERLSKMLGQKELSDDDKLSLIDDVEETYLDYVQELMARSASEKKSA